MKNIAKAVFAALFFCASLFANGFVNKGKTGDISIEIVSQKPLAKGDNNFKIKLLKDGKPVDDAKVTFKVFMPEMPGMPYMEHSDDAKFEKNGTYTSMLGFCMNGTWQINVFIETKEGKKLRYKSSLIF